jgi:glyceraldehyde-3-phosphate dehydrogenase/erythrose-4-phosphate dehydrogenase
VIKVNRRCHELSKCMRVLVVGTGMVGARVLRQLKKNPRIEVVTVDPRDRPYAVEQGIIEDVDYHAELNTVELKETLSKVRPDLVLVTTSKEDMSRTGVSGLEVLVTALRNELEATAEVPIIAVARIGE